MSQYLSTHYPCLTLPLDAKRSHANAAMLVRKLAMDRIGPGRISRVARQIDLVHLFLLISHYYRVKSICRTCGVCHADCAYFI